jgi:hypothetical protein
MAAPTEYSTEHYYLNSIRNPMIYAKVTELINRLEDNYLSKGGANDISHEIIEGKKYYKVVQKVDSGRSVHAFIDKTTGQVYMPASWRAPAKHVRYNLLDEGSYKRCLEKADWAGGYLYM